MVVAITTAAFIQVVGVIKNGDVIIGKDLGVQRIQVTIITLSSDIYFSSRASQTLACVYSISISLSRSN